MNLITRLREFPFLSQLKHRDLEGLLAKNHPKYFKTGAMILKQGEATTQVHLLLEGSVEISAQSPEGRTAQILLQRAPSLFGIIEVWKEWPLLGSVIALEPSTTLAFSRTQYLALLNMNHQACIDMLQFFADQLYESGVEHRVRIFGTAQHTLARYLWVQTQSFGQKFQTGVLIKRKLNKTLIAKSLGMSRRQIIREFETLEKLGLIEWQGEELFLPNPLQLKLLSERAWLECRKIHRKE